DGVGVEVPPKPGAGAVAVRVMQVRCHSTAVRGSVLVGRPCMWAIPFTLGHGELDFNRIRAVTSMSPSDFLGAVVHIKSGRPPPKGHGDAIRQGLLRTVRRTESTARRGSDTPLPR